MSSRMRRPETVRLEISRGDWLLVKKHLTAGEYRAMMGRMVQTSEDGVRTSAIDPIKIGLSKIVAYLLDWSITDADEKPVPVLDQPIATVEAALDALDPESWQEILKAIEKHEAAIEDTRKNDRSGERAPAATSTSAA